MEMCWNRVEFHDLEPRLEVLITRMIAFGALERGWQKVPSHPMLPSEI